MDIIENKIIKDMINSTDYRKERLYRKLYGRFNHVIDIENIAKLNMLCIFNRGKKQ